MSQQRILDEISEVIGRRFRKVSAQTLAPLREAVETLNFFAFEQRMDALGFKVNDFCVYETDVEGNVVSLFIDDAGGEVLPLVARLSALQMILLGDEELTDRTARMLAKLEHLQTLMAAIDEDGENVFSELSKSASLKCFVSEDLPEKLDLAPLRNMRRLRTLALLSDWEEFSNAPVLAECPGLVHLGLEIDELPDWPPLNQVETLLLDGKEIKDSSLARTFPNLRSLVTTSTVPFESLTALANLRRLITPFPFETLAPLHALRNLEALEIESSKLVDLSSVRGFAKLSGLDIAGGATADISHLSGLGGLAVLNLSRNPIAGWPRSMDLQGLRHLVFEAQSDHRLTDIAGLSRCSALEVLNLDGHALDDLEFLQPLGNLHSLNVSRNRLTDVAAIARLPNLRSLDVSYNEITSLAPLGGNATLTHLVVSHNPVANAGALLALSQLEDLEVANCGLTSLAFAKRMPSLVSLDASHNSITTIEPLCELSHLTKVNLAMNSVAALSSSIVDGLRSLESLMLDGNPIEGIDRELFSRSGQDTTFRSGQETIKALRHYYRALSEGSVKHNQVKLLLVGNGRVGKTSIVSRLIDNQFDENQPSTHGIQLRRWPIEGAAAAKLDGRPLDVTVWDFGGQDIYHATHRLFMRTRALFLLVWDKKTEADAFSLDEYGERYENFPLAYWIDYIKSLSGSQVLVIQNKVDSWQDKQHSYGLELQQGYPPPGGIVDYLYVSARKPDGNGFPALTDSIKQLFETSTEIGRDLPTAWVEVRNTLAAIEQRYLEFDEFARICRKSGLLPGEDESLARFLHETGTVFYRPERFAKRLVLDQKWAIDAVYAIFDRRGAAYRDLRAAARNGLTLDVLQSKVWRQFSIDEHQLLLEFMRSCELCFEFTKGIFYIPQLLPDDKPSRVAVRWKDDSAHRAQISFPFLHRAIVDRFLVRTGLLGADSEPEIWRNGIVIIDPHTNTEALVEAVPKDRRLVVQARGREPVELLRRILKEFEDIAQGFTSSVSVSADGGRQFVDLERLRQHSEAGAIQVLSNADELTDIAPLVPFLIDDGTRLPKGTMKRHRRRPTSHDDDTPDIFLSYAWGDIREAGESREAIVDRLYAILRNKEYKVVRDKQNNGYRKTISDFMRRLGKGKLIVVVISDKYLKSPYCMFELLEIYRAGRFHERVLPIVLSDARIYDLADRIRYMQYWQDKKNEIETLLRDVGLAAFSSEGAFKEYDEYYKEVFNNVDKLTALLRDWNALTPTLLEENSFEPLIEEIERQLDAE
jgi:internalin A